MLYFAFSLALLCAAICGLTTLFKAMSIIRALPYCIILLVGIQCSVYGVLSFAGLGPNGFINACINILICTVCVLCHLKSATKHGISLGAIDLSSMKKLPKRIGSKEDVAALLFNLIIILVLMFSHFGFDLSLVFISSDSAAHCSNVLQCAAGKPVEAQYAFGLSGGCLVDMISQIIPSEYYYKCYVITEFLWCWLSMQMMYTLISSLAKRLNIFIRLLLCTLYVIGYPFYSVNMGFGYFGTSIAVVCAIFFTVTCLPLDKSLILICAMLLLIELAVSYLLFVPPVFAAVFIALFMKNNSSDKRVGMALVKCFLVFFVPCLFAVLLNYAGLFFHDNTSSPNESINALNTALARDAGTPKVLYADFIFIIPIAIFGFFSNPFSKKWIIRFGLFPIIFVVYCILLFILCLVNVVSPYYFYKTYAVLWLLFFSFAAVGIKNLLGSSKGILCAYACVWLAIICIAVTGLEEKLSEKRPNLDSSPIASQLFPLYSLNMNTSRNPIFSGEDIAQFREESGDVISESNVAALLGENETRWFRALGFDGKTIIWRADQFHEHIYDAETIVESIGDTEYVYIDNSFFEKPYPNADYSSLDEVVQIIQNEYDVAFETDYGTAYKRR